MGWVKVLVTAASIVVGLWILFFLSACQSNTTAGNSKIVDYQHRLPNGKAISCVVLIEDKAGAKDDEPSGIDCDWTSAR